MKFDSVTVVPFPDSAAFGAMHEKFFEPLVNSLNHAYSFADREDAVEEAFYKLMFKKDRAAYEKEPETESDWFYALRWQARAELSHRRENAERHAKYVEEAAKALADVSRADTRARIWMPKSAPARLFAPLRCFARIRMSRVGILKSTQALRPARCRGANWPRAIGLLRTMSMLSNTVSGVFSVSMVLAVSHVLSKRRATSHSRPLRN